MDVLQSPHTRLPSQKDGRLSLAGTPLDLTFMKHKELERASDSPLDLSLKTRKRCADTTGHDDDIIFIAQRTPEKRICFENSGKFSQELRLRQVEQSHDWNDRGVTHGVLSFEGNGTVYDRGGYCASDSPKTPSKTIHHISSEPCSNTVPTKSDVWGSRLQNIAPLSNFHKNICPKPGFAQDRLTSESRGRRMFGADAVNDLPASTYPSRLPDSGSLAHNTISYMGNRTVLPPQQVFHPRHGLSTGCSHSRALTPNFSQGVPTSVKPVTTFTATSSMSPKESHSLLTHQLHTRQPKSLCRFQGPSSELRAALSSVGRYYPSQTLYSNPMVFSQIPVSQSCSPDSTFSPANSCSQTKSFPIQKSCIDSVNVVQKVCGQREEINHSHTPSTSPLQKKSFSPSVMPTSTLPLPSAKHTKRFSPSLIPVAMHGSTSPSIIRTKNLSPHTLPVNSPSPSSMSVTKVSTPLFHGLPTNCLSSPTVPVKSLSSSLTHVKSPSPSSDPEVRTITENFSKHILKKQMISGSGNAFPGEEDSRVSPAGRISKSPVVSAFHSVTKRTMNQDIKSAYSGEQFETPLRIAIPCESKIQKVNTGSEKTEVVKTVARDRKLTCKKHMILNAVNQDEELKMLSVPSLTKSPPTIRTDSASPVAEQPHSPKMPILSPQHHNPPPLASPFVNEPPPLEPTTEDKLEIGPACPNLSIGSGLGVCASVSTRAIVPLRKSNEISTESSIHPAVANGSVHSRDSVYDCGNIDGRNVPAVKNLSAFVPTGQILSESLPSKCALDSDLNLSPKFLSVADQKSYAWVSTGMKKCADMRCDRVPPPRKIIPVANVAPILKVHSNPSDEDTAEVNISNEKPNLSNGGKTLDLQAEIAAYKTSLRMPAKLISKSQSGEDKRTGIAEEFGASKGRFRHLETGADVPNLRATYGKLFGAKGISKCYKPLSTEAFNGDINEKDDCTDKFDRNVWDSLTVQNAAEQVATSEAKPEVTADNLASRILAVSPRMQRPCTPSRQSPCSTSPPNFERQSPSEGYKRIRPPSRFKFRRVDGKLRAELRKDNEFPNQSGDLSQRRHRRSMLDEIANSEGYVAETRREKKGNKGDLFADPALLSREERALQKAMMRFTEMESGSVRCNSSVQKPKRHSNTRQRANQLKRKALRQSPNKQDNRSRNGTCKCSPNKKGFVDFQPEVLQSRTRMQSKGIHSVGGYNRDAAYENELVNDARRRELKRARRRAKQMANERANARKVRREQNARERDKSTDKHQNDDCSKERVSAKKPQQQKNLAKSTKSPKQSSKKSSGEIFTTVQIKQEPGLVNVMSPSKLKAQLALEHLDELPDLINETKCADLNGCWEVRDMANSEALRQTLRSGRKKGGILMKLSWRPMTAATKGKPRIAHARVSRKNNSRPKSVRMLQLRRRAQLAFLQATRGERQKCNKKPLNVRHSRKVRNSVRDRPPRLRAPVSEHKKKTKVYIHQSPPAQVRERRRRQQLRRGQRETLRETRKSHARKRGTLLPPRPRYPLRDLVVKTEDEDGYTTEEYEFEPGDNPVYSEDDDSVYDDRMETWSDTLELDRFPEIPEPAELRKLRNVNKNSGETVLHRAARLGYEDVAFYCLRTQTVDVNARDNAGYTPLHEACVGGQSEMVRHLLGFGANPNACTQDGVRPMQYALQNDNIELVRLMLSYGADPLLDATDDVSPSMLSVINGYLRDINGYTVPQDEIPWKFYGSSLIEEENGVEHSLFTNVPLDEEDEDIDSIFVASDVPQFVSYRLKVPEAESDDNYVILARILDQYNMTRGSFLRELGPQIRIFSLSRSMLEEEIMHASSISAPLTEAVKQSQTVEVIRLSDVQIVMSHIINSTKGKRSAFKQLTGSGSGIGKCKMGSGIVDPDVDYIRGLAPREFSRTLHDLTAPCNYVTQQQMGRKCVNGSPKLSYALNKSETYPSCRRSQNKNGHVNDTDRFPFKDNGTKGVLPELLNSSERFLKLNESSTRNVIQEEHGTVSISVDLKPESTWTNSCKKNNLDAKNNNSPSSKSLYSIAHKKTSSLEEELSRIDR